MNPVGRPNYRLPTEYKWCTKFRDKKRILKQWRRRAILAFEYSIRDDTWNNQRIVGLCVELMERYWAAKYPEIVDTPTIQVYDLRLRSGLWFDSNNLTVVGNLSKRLELAGRGKSGLMGVGADVLEWLRKHKD